MEATSNELNSWLPFSTYPNREDELRKSIWTGGNCRHEYGLKFIQETHQTCCAYCGKPLTESYDAWVTMVIDHVVPVSVCKGLNIQMEFCRSLANMVLACATCNGFDNRYRLTSERKVSTFREFLVLRDEIFIARRERIQRKHESEKKFFAENIAPDRA